MKKLNFGCGSDIKEGYDNVDRKDFDFQVFPYPIESDTYDYVYCRCVFEHLYNIRSVFLEFERICKNGAIIKIITPYYAHYNAYSAFDHCHYFNDMAFDCLEEYGINYIYKKKLTLHPSILGFFIPFKKFFSKYIFGLIREIEIEFEVRK